MLKQETKKIITCLKKIKILDVINHTSGLKTMPDDENLIYIKYKYASSCMKKNINDDAHKIGTDNYSNICYIILGHIIEKITKLTYIDAYKKWGRRINF